MGGYIRVYPGSGQVMYDDASVNDYYDAEEGYTVIAVFCKFYINSVKKNVWLIRKIHY